MALAFNPSLTKTAPPPDEGDKPDETLQGDDPKNDEPVDIPDEQGCPISIYNGNNIHYGADLKFDTSFENGFVFNRRYNSRFKAEDTERLPQALNAYGFGWTHTYNSAIGSRGWYTIFDSQNPSLYYYAAYLILMDETGRTLYFRKNKVGSLEYYGAFDEPTKVYLTERGYEWHRTDGSIHVFRDWDGDASDPSGELIVIMDANGNRRSLTYDANQRLETVTDEATGRVLTFNYNTDGLLEHITGPVVSAVPDGIWVSYDYDAIGNLTSVSYADGSGRVYEYDDPFDPHNLTAEKDQDGNLIFTWTYDNQDRGISNTTNDDRSVTIDYINDTTIDVTNAYGVNHTFGFESLAGQNRITTINGPVDCSNCGEDTVRYGYNDKGRVEEVEYVNGRIDRYENYDDRGNAQTEIRDFGDLDELAIHTIYHPSSNKPLSRTQAGVLGSGDKVTIWDYDDDGNAAPNENPTANVHRLIQRGFTLDDTGEVTPFEYITVFEYNDKGRVTVIDGPRPGSDDQVTYAYDETTANLASVTQPLVGTTHFTQYDAAGNPTRITDPNGVESELTYDGRNRVLTVTRNGATTSTTYTLEGKPDQITDAAGSTLDFEYSPESFLERIIDPAGNYHSFSYNALGNQDNDATYTAGGIQTRTQRYDYGDPLTNPQLEAGKPWKAISRNPDDTADLETVYAYGVMGNVTSVTDANTNTTTYLYDAQNRLYCIEQPGNAVIDYEYDGQGNLISITDPEGLTTRYRYDDMARLVRIDSPDTGLTVNTYDEAGNRVKEDRNSHITMYAYDALNRLTAITYADDSPGVIYTYDTGTGDYLKGRLTGVIDSSGERRFSYDANGHMDYEQRTISGITYMTDYNFDAAGNLRSMGYPTGQIVEYLPDSLGPGQVAAVKINGTQTLASGLAYLPFGPNTDMTLGNTLQAERSYDKRYGIRTITAGSVLDTTYTPDNIGNISAIADNIDASRSQSFGYDALSRLTSADGIYGNLSFTYDRTGNRLTRTAGQTTDSYAYTPGTNRLAAISGSQTIGFDYDSRGSLIGRTITHGAPPPSTDPANYTYTHDGQRMGKTIGQTTIIYHYDDTGKLIAETDAQGNMIKAYIWLHNQPLAMITADAGVYYYHNDHLGTPQKMTDSSGSVVWAADYLPFGQADVIVGTVGNNLRFKGQYYDQETGLHYNYHRYYDPQLGRYLRADPIGLAGGINPYAYTLNNPVNAVDPLGLLVLYYGGGAAAGAGLNSDHNYYAGSLARYNHIRMKDFKLTQSGLSTNTANGNILGLTGGAGLLAGINFSDTKSYQNSKAHGFVFLGLTVGWTTDNSDLSGLFFGFGGKGGGIGFYNEWESNTTLYPSVTWIQEVTGPCP